MVKRIIIAGVGGQGILLASDILSAVCMKNNYDVKKSEVHGMSQRGGDVVSHVVFGDKVYSSLIGEGSADILLSFERIEALRNIHFLKENGIVLVNDMKILPLPVASGVKDYPKDPIGEIKSIIKNTIVIDAQGKAKEIGNIKVMNIILLGLLSKYIDIDKASFIETIKEKVPPKTVELNLKAFEEGYNYSK